jgi:glyoxylase I family protein
MDHLCLRIDHYDAEAIAAHLIAHGVRLGSEGRRYGADGFGPSLYLFDPEGNMIELKGPPEAARITSL